MSEVPCTSKLRQRIEPGLFNFNSQDPRTIVRAHTGGAFLFEETVFFLYRRTSLTRKRIPLGFNPLKS